MAVGMLLSGEGVTRQGYEELTRAMFGEYPMRAEQAPDGAIMHTAGDSPMGFYIYDIWESKEKFMQFAQEKLGPAAAAAGMAAPEPTFFEIEVMVEGSAR